MMVGLFRSSRSHRQFDLNLSAMYTHITCQCAVVCVWEQRAMLVFMVCHFKLPIPVLHFLLPPALHG